MIRRVSILVAFWFVAFTFVLVKPAWAYIDPATTTYLIQIAAAVVITLGVSLSIFLYRFKMIMTNIRVKAHSFRERMKDKGAMVPEEDIVVSFEDGEQEALSAGIIDYPIPAREYYPALALPSLAVAGSDALEADAILLDSTATDPSTASKKPNWLRRLGRWFWRDERRFKQRLLPAALMAGGLAMTFFIFGMLDSVIMNETKMSFSVGEVIGSVLLVGLVFFVVLSLLLAALRGRVFDIVICFALALLICTYLQSTFLNSSIGQLMGNPLWWDYLGVSSVIINMIVWIAIFVLVFILGLFRKAKIKRFFKGFSLFMPSLIIAVQLIALFSILPPPNTWNNNQSSGAQLILTEKNLYKVASGHNIIVFCLDTLDSDYISSVARSDPSFNTKFDGFTRFTNVVSQFNSTFPSVICYMSGAPYRTDITSAQWTNLAYEHGSFAADIHDEGYSVDLFMERPYMYLNGESFEGIADNLEYTYFEFDVFKTFSQLTRLSSLKNAPLALKFAFWLSTDTFSGAEGATVVGGERPYWVDDQRFYERLVSEGLELVDEPGHFIYYHFNGPHSPWTLDAHEQYVEEGTSPTEQAKGSFFMLNEYFQQMRELGIYKDATIIIMGDHPAATGKTHLDYPMLVGLLVKPAGSDGVPVQINNAPIELYDLAPTCIEAAGGDTSQWGKTFFEYALDEYRERNYYRRIYTEGGRKHFLLHYLITGDANQWSSWDLIEEIYQPTKNWF